MTSVGPAEKTSARLPGLRLPASADLPLTVALAAELLVLTLLPRVLTVDGPAHLLGAWVLAHPSDPLLRHYYRIDLTPVPNLLTSLLLAGLLRLLSPDSAEKALVAGYVVLFPVALRYALRGVDERAGWLAVLAVPLTPAYLFTWGFYNLFYGLALSLLVAGLVLRRRHGWSPGSAAALAVLLLLTWSAHLLPFLVVGLLVGLVVLARVVAEQQQLLHALRRHLLPVAVAALPVLVLTLSFVTSPAARRGPPHHQPFLRLLGGLLTMWGPLVSYSAWEAVPAGVLAVVLLGLAVTAVRHRRGGPERRALALTGALVTVGFFVSPQDYGPDYGFLNDRLSLFPPLLLLLWAAGPRPGRVVGRVVVAAALGAALLVAGLRVPVETRYQHDVAELMSVAPSVPRGSTLLPVQLWRDAPSHGHLRNPHRDALRHEVSRLAVLTGGVDVEHYEAILDYFPARFRTDVDPRHRVDPSGRGLWEVPPVLTLRAATPSVDVVVVLGRRRAGAAQRGLAAPVLADLELGYRRVVVSRPTGLAEVWVRR